MPTSNDRPPENRGLTAIAGAMSLITVLLIVQIWLLSAALESFLGGNRHTALGLKNKQSDTYKELSVMLPRSLPKVIAGQDLTENEATHICLAILKYETKRHKGFVGPPYIITAIRRSGLGGAVEHSYEGLRVQKTPKD